MKTRPFARIYASFHGKIGQVPSITVVSILQLSICFFLDGQVANLFFYLRFRRVEIWSRSVFFRLMSKQKNQHFHAFIKRDTLRRTQQAHL
jgi:hypothetical protein